MKNRRYINSYASTAAIINLQSQIDEIRAGGGGSGEGGDTSALEARVTAVENSLKNYATADALDTAIAGVEGQVDAVEATVSDKLGVDDVTAWAKSEDPTLIPVNKLDDHAVKYSDFEYTPSGEETPVTRKTIQLANYDSISGMNVAGNDAANLIMMSKWDKVDIGSSRYPVNLNGSEFTLNDTDHIATKEELASKADLVDGKVPAEQLPEMSGLVIGTTEGTAYDGGKGTELEGKVTTLEETIVDKLGVDDVATWAKSQDPSVVPLEKMDENVVKYSDFSYTPSGESQPVERKTIQLANYDSISGKNTAGDDAANLIMMSKWDKVDIGSSRYPVNLNGSEFTLNDEKHIATIDQIPEVIEFAGLTDLETGAASASIRAAIGLEFADLVDTIGQNKAIFMDRNAAGDYKTCIHATGNISSGNGGANLMFMVGTVPTIYEVQYVNNEWALYVAEYEFAKKSDIPSLDGYATTQNVSDSIAAEASARDKAIETATSDLVHNTLTVAGKSLTGNITLASSDLTDGAELAKTSDVAGLDAKVFGDLDVSKFEENPELTCQVTKLDASYTGDLGLPDNINGQPYNAETNAVNPSINYLVLGYFDDGFVFHYDAWDALHSSAIFSTIISTVGLTNSTLDNRVSKTTKVAGHALNADVELTSTDLTDGAELAKKDEILNTVVDESRNETLRQSLTARTYLPFARNSDLENQTEAQIFALFSNNVTDRGSLREYVQSNMAYISYNLDSLGEHQYYKSTILMASVPNDGDITIIAIAADIYNGDKLSKFTYTIKLNGDASSVHIEKKALES